MKVKNFRTCFLGAMCITLCAQSYARGQSDEAAKNSGPTESVEVVGVKDPDWKPYVVMLTGNNVFEKHHDIAPNAALLFRLQPQQSGVTLKDISLKISDGVDSYPLPVAPDGSFALPRVPAFLKDDAVLEINRKKSLVRWRPYIVTPGTPKDARRLGDLRLECEVRWEIEKSGFSFIKRNLIDALGGPCKTSRVNTYFFSEQVLDSATIREGQRVQAVYILRGTSAYLPPITDKSWGNDAIVEFKYQ